MSDNTVFQEVQAALLNSECDPFEAGQQGLCALYSFVATELEGSPLAQALDRALRDLRLPPPPYPGEDASSRTRKDLRRRILQDDDDRKAKAKR
jgi:hypothetical protein